MAKSKSKGLYPSHVAFMLIFLSLAMYLFFSIWPIAYSIYVAFTDANNYNIASEPRIRELQAQRANIINYLQNNRENVLKQVYAVDNYLGNAYSSLLTLKQIIQSSTPQNFSVAKVTEIRGTTDNALAYASSIITSNTTFLYYYANLGDVVSKAVTLIDGGIWADIDKIVGFKLILTEDDLAQLRTSVVPKIDQALSLLQTARDMLRQIETNYDSFVASDTKGLDEEIDKISMHFVGLNNFETLFSDSRFPNSIYKTLLF
nr:hypothetical protein [Thermofilum sp.]